MKNASVRAIPEEYKRAAPAERRGTIREAAYTVRNYIHSSRQLATDRNIDSGEAGRETIEGAAIRKTCKIYVPAGYDENDSHTRYDTLYLLHGVGGDENEWLHGSGTADGSFVLAHILDNLIANGDIEPLIVVFPNGRSAHDWEDRTFNAAGTHMLGFYYFDYEFRYDLIPFIEANYRTYADIRDTSPEGIESNRKHRAVAGLSMGGMQSLNLILGGYRCDAAEFAGAPSGWKNGLAPTVRAPGMADLFAYVGAFSNAPTSSAGHVLGSGLASSGRKLELLYMTCGDEDGIAVGSYAGSIEGLAEAAGDSLGDFYQILLTGGNHDFQVWNHGAYNFVRLAFGNAVEPGKRSRVELVLDIGSSERH
ncbi:hypothetical protein J19TS2_27970 [Cohnella xylanilytica]|uniref:alpha/beta hydrolase n=1 Tax=Cohnella xylanilytica TaxID=557555 RepID=UPI001B1ABFED|nr:alpha/beta hydrolase-fold protein [Cohnella xylanilytica]GIO13242.1 hypothetical protein J19TS2_27970 [Cohnella xylanilytica]